MRTTLTLDDDIAAKLKEEMRRSGRSFKETVNTVLRNGLNVPRKNKIEHFNVNPKELKPRITVRPKESVILEKIFIQLGKLLTQHHFQ